MNERELLSRLQAIENNLNNCTAGHLALMAAFSALPDAVSVNPAKADGLLTGMAKQQPALAAVESAAKVVLEMILVNARLNAGR